LAADEWPTKERTMTSGNAVLIFAGVAVVAGLGLKPGCAFN
jgi:hypothetical protein